MKHLQPQISMAARSPALLLWRHAHHHHPLQPSWHLHIRAVSTKTQAKEREDNTITLPDGRRLGYAEYGVPDGRPLLFFHGYPSSRLEGRGAHKLARRLGVRLLCPDRPGFGLSSLHEGRTILDYTEDLRHFARALDLPRFAVLGGSGGGPYALACAYALPNEMLTGVGLFASAPHWAAGDYHMSYTRRLLKYSSRRWPDWLQARFEKAVKKAYWLLKTGPVQRTLDQWLDQQAKKARAESKDNDTDKDEAPSKEKVEYNYVREQRREYFIRVMLTEAFTQGGKGAVEEARLLGARKWGFKLEDITYDPIHIWHGTKDTNAPIVMIRWMARHLLHAQLHEMENETHYTMFPHMEEAIKTLVPQAASQQDVKENDVKN